MSFGASSSSPDAPIEQLDVADHRETERTQAILGRIDSWDLTQRSNSVFAGLHDLETVVNGAAYRADQLGADGFAPTPREVGEAATAVQAARQLLASESKSLSVFIEQQVGEALISSALPTVVRGEERELRERLLLRVAGAADPVKAMQQIAGGQDRELAAAAVGQPGEDVLASKLPPDRRALAHLVVRNAAIEWEKTSGTARRQAAAKAIGVANVDGGLVASQTGVVAIRGQRAKILLDRAEAKVAAQRQRLGVPPERVVAENRIMRAELERRRAAELRK
jgi:hypothetical protein